MKLYKVTLQTEERGELKAITHKGSRQSQKVINALMLGFTAFSANLPANTPWLATGALYYSCSRLASRMRGLPGSGQIDFGLSDNPG